MRNRIAGSWGWEEGGSDDHEVPSKDSDGFGAQGWRAKGFARLQRPTRGMRVERFAVSTIRVICSEKAACGFANRVLGIQAFPLSRHLIREAASGSSVFSNSRFRFSIAPLP